ncbi:unnamed protein product [Clavelina lepadiformis]|uniref:KN motif and ankyrin repeat domain-containing protein 1 n=1 Tax=Clavelina lepadiformis TaxID=159417 RepID=A0ABP0F985_CLALP
MEFNKLKGFWKGSPSKFEKSPREENINRVSFNSNNNSNQNKPISQQIEALEEIKPEITAEGYGLRTPYGTHLNLDFVKYCEDLGQNFKGTSSLRKPGQKTTSNNVTQNQQQTHLRLASGQSNESLNSLASEGTFEMGRTQAQAENTLMETRRRLEAFRSFRTKRIKSTENALNAPPMTSYNNGKNGYSSYNIRRGSTSPASSSSGSLTPNSLGGVLSGNQVTPQHLQIVREQMAAALLRLRELEEQVKTIPALQVKISVLQQENKHLLEDLQISESKSSHLNASIPHSSTISSRNSNLSFSSDISLASSQALSSPKSLKSSIASPYLPSHSNVGVGSSNFPKNLPPPPPKRKYKSVAVGDSKSIHKIVCYHKEERNIHSVGISCELLPSRKTSVDFGSIVDSLDIDAAFNIFPLPPKEYFDNWTSTEQLHVLNASIQTISSQCTTISTQTHTRARKSIACGEDTLYEMCDKICETTRRSFQDKAVMVSQSSPETKEQSTSCCGLIYTSDVAIGDVVSTASTSTSTMKIEKVSKATVCTDLIEHKDKASGESQPFLSVDACTATDIVKSFDVLVECDLPLSPPVVHLDKDVMTEQSSGKWCSYSDMKSVSCGEENDTIARYETTSTNTDSLPTADASVETDSVHKQTVSVLANLQRPTCNASVNTLNVDVKHCSTDCTDILTSLKQNFTKTKPVSKVDVASQNESFTANVCCQTEISQIERKKHSASEEIDTYVEKVQSLLEEQQVLLAENYEVFTEDWNEKPSDKISRFVNPFFSSSNKDPEDDDNVEPFKSAAIAASLSLMSSQIKEEHTTSDEDDESCDEDYYLFVRPLPSPDLDLELKSIMKKPGTPSAESKCLRFAEGVKSDDSSTEENSSDDDEEEEKKDNISMDTTMKQRVQHEANITQLTLPKKGVKNNTVEKMAPTYSELFSKTTSERKENPVHVEIHRQTLNIEEGICHLEEKEFSNLSKLGSPCGDKNGKHKDNQTKYIFTTEMLDACDVLERHLRNPKLVEKSQLVFSTAVVQREWFKIAAQSDSARDPLDDFVADLADTSLPVLRKVVNMSDASGNTVLHYAISHGNFSVVESLLGIDELDVNKSNQAGYTAAMLAALCAVKSDAERKVFQLLFSKSDVNVHAKEAGQTALMLAVSHGRLVTAQLLFAAGAEINARDQDGSTALMCAVEHGQLETVKQLLSRNDCDATLADMDGSTALSIAMEAGHREIAILLYAQLNFKPTVRSPRPRTNCKSMIPSPNWKTIKS